MYLAINTSSDLLTLTLATPAGEILADRNAEARQRQADLLIPTIQEMLAETGVHKSALSGVVVAQGPGSFTGIRIGLMAANTLGYSLKIPVVGLDTLSLWAAHAADFYTDGLRTDGIRTIIAMIDAGRDEVYWNRFTAPAHDGAAWQATAPPRIDTVDAIVEQAEQPAVVVGQFRRDPGERISSLLRVEHLTKLLYIEREVGLGKQMITLGLPLLRDARPLSLDRQILPLYLREPAVTKSKKPHL